MNNNQIFDLSNKIRSSRIEQGKNVVDVGKFMNFVGGRDVGFTEEEAKKLGDAFSINPVGKFSG